MSIHTPFSKQVEDRIKNIWKILYDSAYFKKLQEKSSYFLFIKWMDMKKHQWKSRQMEFWKTAHTICNLHLWYNFALLLQENALVFSQSEACNFLMYIIKHCNNLVQVF